MQPVCVAALLSVGRPVFDTSQPCVGHGGSACYTCPVHHALRSLLVSAAARQPAVDIVCIVPRPPSPVSIPLPTSIPVPPNCSPHLPSPTLLHLMWTHPSTSEDGPPLSASPPNPSPPQLGPTSARYGKDRSALAVLELLTAAGYAPTVWRDVPAPALLPETRHMEGRVLPVFDPFDFYPPHLDPRRACRCRCRCRCVCEHASAGWGPRVPLTTSTARPPVPCLPAG